MWYLTNTAKGRRLLSVGVSEREVRLASAQSTTSLKSQISVHSVPRFVKAIKFQSKILWQHNFIHTILLERKNWYLPCTAKGRHLLSVRGEYVCGGRVRQKTLRTIILFLSSCVSHRMQQIMVSWCYLTSVSSDINLVLRQIYLGIKFSIKKNTGIVQNRKSGHDKWSSVIPLATSGMAWFSLQFWLQLSTKVFFSSNPKSKLVF